MQLHKKYGKDGLAVVMLSDQSEAEVKPYVGDNDIPYVVAVTKKGTFEKYKIRGYPSSFLIDGNGKIVWEGHPMALRDEQVAKVMDTVQLFRLPDLPSSLKSAKVAFEAQKFGDAARKAQARLDAKGASQEEKDAAQMILEEIGKAAKKQMEKAEAAAGSGDYPRALEILDHVQTAFRSMDVAKAARDRETELMRDPAVKKELSAFKLLAKYVAAIDRESTASKRKKWIPTLQAFAKKYEGTKAAEEASDKVRALRSLR